MHLNLVQLHGCIEKRPRKDEYLFSPESFPSHGHTARPPGEAADVRACRPKAAFAENRGSDQETHGPASQGLRVENGKRPRGARGIRLADSWIEGECGPSENAFHLAVHELRCHGTSIMAILCVFPSQ